MRVVVDTGVFISAAIKAQTIPNIAVYQAARRGVLLKSHLSEAELMEVIDRPYLARLIAPAARTRLVELLNPFRGIPIVSPAVFVQGASRPQDTRFTLTALQRRPPTGVQAGYRGGHPARLAGHPGKRIVTIVVAALV